MDLRDGTGLELEPPNRNAQKEPEDLPTRERTADVWSFWNVYRRGERICVNRLAVFERGREVDLSSRSEKLI